MERLLISKKFAFSGVSHLKLNLQQLRTVETVVRKLETGQYELESKSCLCGSSEDVLIAETDRYGFNLNTVICKSCGLLRTNPRMTGASLKEFYQKEYRDIYMELEAPDYRYFEGMVQRGREIFSIFKRAAPHVELKGLKIIEIGCSSGGLLGPFLEAGAQVEGCDYDERYLAYGSERYPDLNLWVGGVEQVIDKPDQYDLIILNHVLEHLPEPMGVLRDLQSKLKPDGYFYLSVPGLTNPAYYHSPLKSFLGALHIAHLYHFSGATLSSLLSGYKTLYIDDEVRGLFKIDAAKKVRSVAADYLASINTIKSYENNLLRRLSFVNYRFVVKSYLSIGGTRRYRKSF